MFCDSTISFKLQKFHVVQHGAVNHLISLSKQQCNNLIIELHNGIPISEFKIFDAFCGSSAIISAQFFSFYTEQNPVLP
jgi:hypothetical protein